METELGAGRQSDVLGAPTVSTGAVRAGPRDGGLPSALDVDRP
jgi:hypothetical protein